MTPSASILAPAKINLYLKVLGRRAGGFHDIETLFQSVDWGDTVKVALTGHAVTLSVSGPYLGPMTENLAYRAAVMYREAAGVQCGIHVSLLKRIPAGAGLGGGSSDAAAVLTLLQHLCSGALSASSLQLLAAELGSDVPFFLCGSTLAAASGRGEVLVPLDSFAAARVYVVMPPVHVATSAAYGALAKGSIESDAGPTSWTPPRVDHWADVIAIAMNDFEATVSALHGEVGVALHALQAVGYPLVMLSGSGGACFALDPDDSIGPPSQSGRLSELGWPIVTTRTLTIPPSVSISC